MRVAGRELSPASRALRRYRRSRNVDRPFCCGQGRRPRLQLRVSAPRIPPRNPRHDEISVCRPPDRHAANSLAETRHAPAPCIQGNRRQRAAALLQCGRAFPFCRAPFGRPCRARCKYLTAQHRRPFPLRLARNPALSASARLGLSRVHSSGSRKF